MAKRNKAKKKRGQRNMGELYDIKNGSKKGLAGTLSTINTVPAATRVYGNYSSYGGGYTPPVCTPVAERDADLHKGAILEWGLIYGDLPPVANKQGFFLGLDRRPAPVAGEEVCEHSVLIEHKDAKVARALQLMDGEPNFVKEFSEGPEEEFLIGYQGVLKKSVYNLGGNLLTMIAPSQFVPGAPAIAQGTSYTVSEKIPHELLKAAMAYAKYIYAKFRTEFAWQIYRHKETGLYALYIPRQIIEGAHVNYSGDADAASNIRNGMNMDLVLEGHSHGAMGAFFSGGDNSNEKTPCNYIVLAGFNADNCTYKARARVLDFDIPLKLTDIFDLPEGRDEAWLLDSVDVPPVYTKAVLRAVTRNTVVNTYGGYGRDYTGITRSYSAIAAPTPAASAASWTPRRARYYRESDFSNGSTGYDYYEEALALGLTEDEVDLLSGEYGGGGGLYSSAKDTTTGRETREDSLSASWLLVSTLARLGKPTSKELDQVPTLDNLEDLGCGLTDRAMLELVGKLCLAVAKSTELPELDKGANYTKVFTEGINVDDYLSLLPDSVKPRVLAKVMKSCCK